MFAHFQQETAGLKYLREINKADYCSPGMWPCTSGQQYYGRGVKQLSWNYNYAPFSAAMLGDPEILLNNPDLVATTWLNFAASMWFFVTPQPPKPSMLEVVEGTWVPNDADKAAKRTEGFGTTILIINGQQECGLSAPYPDKATKRGEYYTQYAQKLGINITVEKLNCNDMTAFDFASSVGTGGKREIFWHQDGCAPTFWPTAYSTLVEGDYARCMGTGTCNGVAPVVPGTTAAPGNGGEGRPIINYFLAGNQLYDWVSHRQG